MNLLCVKLETTCMGAIRSFWTIFCLGQNRGYYNLQCLNVHGMFKLSEYTLFFIRMLFFRPRLDILIFLPILG